MTEKTKPTEKEVQEWLEGVHFSSCCSDPLPSSENENKENKANKEQPKKS